MDAPAEVRAICADHPDAFGDPPETNDARRLALLMTGIIPMSVVGAEGGHLLRITPNDNS